MYKIIMSLDYPAVRPDNPAGYHQAEIRAARQILSVSKRRISDIRLSGQTTIRCFPRKDIGPPRDICMFVFRSAACVLRLCWCRIFLFLVSLSPALESMPRYKKNLLTQGLHTTVSDSSLIAFNSLPLIF